MFSKSKKKGAMCAFCMSVNIIVSVFAVIGALAAIAGVYKAHVLSTGLAFGTTSGSLSLLALVFSLFLVKKALENCTCQCDVPSKK